MRLKCSLSGLSQQVCCNAAITAGIPIRIWKRILIFIYLMFLHLFLILFQMEGCALKRLAKYFTDCIILLAWRALDFDQNSYSEQKWLPLEAGQHNTETVALQNNLDASVLTWVMLRVPAPPHSASICVRVLRGQMWPKRHLTSSWLMTTSAALSRRWCGDEMSTIASQSSCSSSSRST